MSEMPGHHWLLSPVIVKGAGGLLGFYGASLKEMQEAFKRTAATFMEDDVHAVDTWSAAQSALGIRAALTALSEIIGPRAGRGAGENAAQLLNEWSIYDPDFKRWGREFGTPFTAQGSWHFVETIIVKPVTLWLVDLWTTLRHGAGAVLPGVTLSDRLTRVGLLVDEDYDITREGVTGYFVDSCAPVAAAAGVRRTNRFERRAEAARSKKDADEARAFIDARRQAEREVAKAARVQRAHQNDLNRRRHLHDLGLDARAIRHRVVRQVDLPEAMKASESLLADVSGILSGPLRQVTAAEVAADGDLLLTAWCRTFQHQAHPNSCKEEDIEYVRHMRCEQAYVSKQTDHIPIFWFHEKQRAVAEAAGATFDLIEGPSQYGGFQDMPSTFREMHIEPQRSWDRAVQCIRDQAHQLALVVSRWTAPRQLRIGPEEGYAAAAFRSSC
jgi:hypothetical protein